MFFIHFKNDYTSAYNNVFLRRINQAKPSCDAMRQIRRRHAVFNIGVTACFCTCWIEVGEDHRSFGAVAGFVAAAGSRLCLRRLLGGRLGAFLQFSDIEKSFRQKTALRYFLQPWGWELKKKDGKKTAHVAQIAYPTHPPTHCEPTYHII